MSPGPVVLKFGGTSVADAEAIGRLVRHVAAAHRARRVPWSWCPRCRESPTGCLHLAAAAAAADEAAVGGRSRRAAAAPRRGRAPGGARVDGAARAHRGRRGRAPQSAARRRHPEGRRRRARATPWPHSASSSAAASSKRPVEAAGLPAVWVDPRRVLITNDTFGCALPLMDETDGGRRRTSRAARRRPATCRSIGGYVGATTSGRDHDARPRRVGLLGGDPRRGARRQRDPDLDRRRRHDDGRSAGRRLDARRAAAVVRGGLGARLFRREGPAPEHDSARRREEHPGQDPQQPPVRRRRHAHHRRARRSTSRSPRSPASATSRSSTSPRRAC